MTGIVNETGAVSGLVGQRVKAAGGAGGLHKNTQVFTSTGTYTRTAGVTKVFVEIVAGGGGGSGHGESGGAG